MKNMKGSVSGSPSSSSTGFEGGSWQLLEHGGYGSHGDHGKVNGKINVNSREADEAETTDERATATAFLVGVAGETLRRAANKGSALAVIRGFRGLRAFPCQGSSAVALASA